MGSCVMSRRESVYYLWTLLIASSLTITVKVQIRFSFLENQQVLRRCCSDIIVVLGSFDVKFTIQNNKSTEVKMWQWVEIKIEK